MNIKSENIKSALIIATFGHNYIVCTINIHTNMQQYLQARFKGKKQRAVVGDMVDIQITAYAEQNKQQVDSQAIITNIHPRKNLLYRSDAFKSKIFASNLDRILFVVAVEPNFSTLLIDHAIIASINECIPLTIILNKCDLDIQALNNAREKLTIYNKLGYEIIETCATTDLHKNNQNIAQKNTHVMFEHYKQTKQRCLLMGQSGMGKSSLINAYMPHANVEVQAISQKLDSGKHTTTHTKLHLFKEENIQEGYLIDSPGFQLFGLHHLSASQIIHGFSEFKPFLGQCKFSNCMHVHEPNCAVLNAHLQGFIQDNRLDSYHYIIQPWIK
jgi:ribosome biogenesis GTPase / thiamine phosphate phosphatase